jgi:hypothetical protein
MLELQYQGTQILRAADVQFYYTVLSGENKSSLSTCMNSAYTNTSSMEQDISVSIVPRLWAGPKNQGSLFHTNQASLLHSTHIVLGTTVSHPLVTEFPSPGMNK